MDAPSRPKSSTRRSPAAPKSPATPGKAAGSSLTGSRTPKGVPAGPTHQQIAERAYLIHLARGGGHGSAADDWHQAERELTAPGKPVRKRVAKS